MAINWFPGHMHKARKEIKEIMPQVDLILEVLDARIPCSSEIAKTGNEPAVTKMQQRQLPNNIVLLDTPGFLWPKLTPEVCGYRLATTGAIKEKEFRQDEHDLQDSEIEEALI